MMIFFILYPLFIITLCVAMIAGMWKVFEKAGKPGWAAIVPIYNVIIMVEIVKKPPLWIFLALFPCTAPIGGILIAIELAKCFGKEGGFVVGMILLPFVFYPILGFGDAKYQG